MNPSTSFQEGGNYLGSPDRCPPGRLQPHAGVTLGHSCINLRPGQTDRKLSITLGLADLHSVYLLTSETLPKDEGDYEGDNEGTSVSLPLSLRFDTP